VPRGKTHFRQEASLVQLCVLNLEPTASSQPSPSPPRGMASQPTAPSRGGYSDLQPALQTQRIHLWCVVTFCKGLILESAEPGEGWGWLSLWGKLHPRREQIPGDWR